jgi:hypothetical protein
MWLHGGYVSSLMLASGQGPDAFSANRWNSVKITLLCLASLDNCYTFYDIDGIFPGSFRVAPL